MNTLTDRAWTMLDWIVEQEHLLLAALLILIGTPIFVGVAVAVGLPVTPVVAGAISGILARAARRQLRR